VIGANVNGSHSKRQAGIPSLVQAAPQLGHPSTPGVVDVLDNKPIRANPNELCDPSSPACLPAIDKSWQGKPAVTIKPSLKHSDAEIVDFAKADGFPSNSLRSDGESSDAAE
jgi:hypothetical protein